MKRYRIGQEITVRWAILSSGEPRPLAGRDLKLVLHSPRYADHQIDNFTTDGNVAEFNITPDMAKMTGVYSLTLWENYGKPRQTAVDSCRAFELVPTTCDIDNCHDLADGETLQLCSFLDTGIKGDPGEGVPAGGATGQILSKASDKDFDSAWEYPAGRRAKSASGQSSAEVHNESQFQGGDTLPGHNSFSEGSGFAAGAYAHAEGGSTTASGEYTHAEGLNTTATGSVSHAENRQTIASGDYSHAGGSQSEARGTSSFAHGKNAVAVNEGEVVFGMNPEVDDSGNSIFQLGAGSGAAEGKRKTVFRIDKDGTIICTDPTTGEKMALQEVIKQVQQTLYDFFNNAEDADETINKWHEVEAFLAGIKETDNLAGILSDINAKLNETADLSQVVRTDDEQNLTDTARNTARINISAMADTPSGDPMHYMFEQAGALWIPYSNITTDGLEDWQIETLNMEQAQVDGGVWWHNDIFVSKEQNRQNYISTIGTYPVQLNGYTLYLTANVSCTTNYKDRSVRWLSPTQGNDMCRYSNFRTIYIPPIAFTNLTRAFSENVFLYKIIGAINLTQLTTPNYINNIFNNSPNLRHVQLYKLRLNINLSTNNNLSIESGVYFINNVAADATGVVVILHAAAYERFIADPTIQAALAAHTNITLAAAGSTAVASAAAPARMMSLRAAPLLVTEPEIADGQLVAPAGMFITQAADVADSERLYFTRKTWNVDDDISIWRAAAVSECVEWQARMAAEDDAMVINN